MLLEGRVAIITGGASGLGLATAKRFAAEGAIVVINDIRADAARSAAATLGVQHMGLAGDVSKESDVTDMVNSVMEKTGRIDILINNAGMADSFEPTVSQDLSHWQRLIDVHLTGTYLVSKTVAPYMIATRRGAMVNLSSIAGVLGLPVRTAYSAAKAGISMVTRVLACEWGPDNVRVNAIAPGYMLTPLLQALIDEGKVDADRIRRRTPMGKFGHAEDIADCMLFLVSDQAKFITGITVPVDGGYCAWGAASDAHPSDHLSA